MQARSHCQHLAAVHKAAKNADFSLLPFPSFLLLQTIAFQNHLSEPVLLPAVPSDVPFLLHAWNLIIDPDNFPMSGLPCVFLHSICLFHKPAKGCDEAITPLTVLPEFICFSLQVIHQWHLQDFRFQVWSAVHLHQATPLFFSFPHLQERRK